MYDYIKERLKELGKTQKDLAEAMGIETPHLSAVFKGIRLVKTAEIIPMARCLNVSIENLTKYLSGQLSDAELIAKPIKQIFKVGYVQAGKFNDAAELPRSEWQAVPYAVDDTYSGADIFALGVHGNSMNKIFPPDKTTLVCCPIIDWVDKNPDGDLNGKYIIAYRTSPDGKIEATVKKYNKIDENLVILEPESTDPEFKQIVLTPDNNEYEIHAVVISYIRSC